MPESTKDPLHQLVGKGRKGSVSRASPEETWQIICSQHPDSYFPFSSCLCYQHWKIHKTASFPGEHATGVSDYNFEPGEMYIGQRDQDVLLNSRMP